MVPRKVAFSMLAFMGVAIPVPAFAAASTVMVGLADKGASADLPKGLGMEMKGTDGSMALMQIKVQPANVKSGEVTFEVTNSSKELVHEMVVARVTSGATLPYDADETKVKEDEAASLGEVEELDPGKHGTLTLNLEPGDYVLFCNVPGHYDAGMWTRLTVEP